MTACPPTILPPQNEISHLAWEQHGCACQGQHQAHDNDEPHHRFLVAGQGQPALLDGEQIPPLSGGGGSVSQAPGFGGAAVTLLNDTLTHVGWQ